MWSRREADSRTPGPVARQEARLSDCCRGHLADLVEALTGCYDNLLRFVFGDALVMDVRGGSLSSGSM